MTRSLLLSVLACCLTWAQASAQDVDDSRPAPTNVRGAEYPRIHSDNRVTFRLKAPEARKVQLQPNDDAVENGLGKGPYNMVRGDDGIWTVTTPPAVPGLHLYDFLVDGVPANDPGSEGFISGRATSGIEVPESPPSGAASTSIRRRNTIARFGSATPSFIYSTAEPKTITPGCARAGSASLWIICWRRRKVFQCWW